MQQLKHHNTQDFRPDTAGPEIEELPIRVAEDWNELVARSEKMAEVIDKHLDFESKLQGRELRPITLCPEQKVSLVSDLSAI
jgi:hypothetical protein